MKGFELLKKVIEIMKKNLSVTIYDTFSSNIIKLPIVDKFLTIEISSGSEDKTLITITSYAPQNQGANICRSLTKKTLEILNSSKIEDLNEISMSSISFDKTKKAYIQKCKLTFKMPKDITSLIVFGNEKIKVKEDLTLKYSRNISIYYSQLCGVQLKDLGKALRKVDGTAIVSTDQFQRLCELISIGNTQTLSVEGQKFNAILTSLERKAKNLIYLSFLEVLNEH